MDNIHITYFDQDINITAYEQVNILLKIQKTNLEKKILHGINNLLRFTIKLSIDWNSPFSHFCIQLGFIAPTIYCL